VCRKGLSSRARTPGATARTRRAVCGRYLLNRLPRRADGGVDIGEIDLSHLRVEKTTTVGIGHQYFGPHRSFRSNLDRSARRAAWRMIRREENVEE
jgi:hypothetical protein